MSTQICNLLLIKFVRAKQCIMCCSAFNAQIILSSALFRFCQAAVRSHEDGPHKLVSSLMHFLYDVVTHLNTLLQLLSF